MAFNSSIEWTETTWNKITGRTKVSPGCLPQMCVSVENQNYTYRIDHLIYTHAIIVGDKSGPKTRPTCLTVRQMKEEWVIEIRDECKKAKVPFFFSHSEGVYSERDGKPKQWGGVNKKKNGRVLKGRTWDEMPILRTG